MEIKENAGLKGVYRLTRANLETPEHFALNDEITKRREAGVDFSELLARLHSMCKLEVLEYANLIPTVGRTLIANNLTAVSPTNLMLIKYAELGSGGTAPANGNTTLQTSVYRNAIASRTNASNLAYVTAFFNATETTGTYAEAGIFCDGTASAGTGILLSRVLISVTKTSTQTLTIDWTLTIS